jgi:Protein of unknown function (DUF3304)
MLTLLRILPTMATCLLSACLLGGCEEPTVGVNIHGVNYSGNTFSFSVSDPAKPKSGAGSGLIDPFGASGISCCVTLPKKWQPGIKVLVHTRHWLPKLPDGTLPEVKEEHVVEVPQYGDGTPGELWVLRWADGSLSVVSSDFQPDHPKWPGKVKGWPVPSLEYQRERWEIYRKHEEGGVRLFESLLNQLKKDPIGRAKEDWEFTIKDTPSALKGFSGPEDPRYHLALRKEYEEGLARSKRRLKEVMEARP